MTNEDELDELRRTIEELRRANATLERRLKRMRAAMDNIYKQLEDAEADVEEDDGEETQH